MERSSDQTGIEATLRELRPAPRPEFAAELDAGVAARFPRHSRPRRLLPAVLGERLPVPGLRQMAFAGGVTALVAIAVATALVAGNGPSSKPIAYEQGGKGKSSRVQFSESPPTPPRSSGVAVTESAASGTSSFSLPNRAIERSAQVTLLAVPEDVADDSAQVFAAVHDVHGIVLRSNTSQGPAGRAGARFDLLIPSARLGDALAAISAIDEVGSRHDTTADITAPTVAVGQHLRDVHASIESLLAELSSVETEAEREVLEARIRQLRRQAATLQAQLNRLHARTHYSHVAVRIETGRSSDSGGTWSIDDAFHDARHVLGVAAGIILVAIAVVLPLLLLVLLAWLAHRAWLRIRRERALSGGV